MHSFGDILSELREDRGLTQKELGKMLNVTGGAISSYEKGVHFPDFDRLIQLASIFNVSTDYLLGYSDVDISPSALKATFANGKTIAELITQLNALSPDAQNALMVLVDVLSEH